MSATDPTWRELAILLGERLRYQAHQCPVADGDERRRDQQHDRQACPFCCDTDAAEAYFRKTGTHPTASPVTAETNNAEEAK